MFILDFIRGGYFKGWFHYSWKVGNVHKLALAHINCIISKKSVVYRYARLNSCFVDDYSYVGTGTIMRYTNVGKFTSISDYCVIGMPAHNIDTLSSSPLFTYKNNGTGQTWCVDDVIPRSKIHVEIGSDVWIGYGVKVVNNIKIGNGSVIAAGAVVVRDVPDYAIVGGVPAKLIRYRFSDEDIKKLSDFKWWEKSDEELKNNLHLFSIRPFSFEHIKNNWKY